MHVIILGANGMLGTDLMAACRHAGTDATGLDLPDFDIAQDTSTWPDLSAVDAVVNCAAYTDVDGAESNRETAFAINADGPQRVAEWCADRDIPLFHISTDYVFDGETSAAYTEDAPVHPINVYGESKLAGEKAIQAVGAHHLIIRTQSLFGLRGRHFVSAILDKARRVDQLEVVNDQTSCPTYTPHLAAAILHLLRGKENGIVHVADSGACTWYEFAVAICRAASLDTRVVPVSAAQFPRPARRPAYSVLDTSRYQAWTGRTMPTWQEGLAAWMQAG